MYSFKQYLNEAKNTHLEHLEDNIINNGYSGGLEAVEFLKAMYQSICCSYAVDSNHCRDEARLPNTKTSEA